MLFCTTLRNYGYTVKPLWELVRELRDHYTEVLMQRWVQVFREILSKEDFQPIKVILVYCFIYHIGYKLSYPGLLTPDIWLDSTD